MIKKLAFALSVTTICSNIQPAHGFQSNNVLESDRARISVKKYSAKKFTREKREDRKRNLLAKRKARTEMLAERRKTIRLAKIERLEKIANSKNIQKNKRTVLKNKLTQQKEIRKIRIVKKKSEIFENRLVRRSLKKNVNKAMSSILSQVKNELTPIVAMLKNLQPMEPVKVKKSKASMAIKNVETRTVVMEKPQQLVVTKAASLIEKTPPQTLVPITSLLRNLEPVASAENKLSPVSQKSPLVEQERRDDLNANAILEKVNSTLEHVKNSFNKLKEESYDQLFSYVSNLQKDYKNLEDQQEKIKELLNVSGKINENLENQLKKNDTSRTDHVLNQKMEDLHEEVQDLMSDLKIVKSAIVDQNSEETPKTSTQDTTPSKDEKDGYPATSGSLASNEEDEKAAQKPTKESKNLSNPSQSIRFTGQMMVPPANLPEQAEDKKQAKLSSSILSAETPEDLVPALDHLISLGNSLRLPEGQNMERVTNNFALLRNLIKIEGKREVESIGDAKNEMELLSKSIKLSTENVQNKEKPNTTSSGVLYIKTWLSGLLGYNNS